jgi:hypothetical protein
MNKNIFLNLIFSLFYICLNAQIGYFDAPYNRYEANLGNLINGASTTLKSYSQSNLQSEASDQICVALNVLNDGISFNVNETADGMVIRYSVPDGTTATLGIYNGTIRVAGLNLTSHWSWENLVTTDANITNTNPKKRFDEVRFRFAEPFDGTTMLKLILESGTANIDFVEMELVQSAISAPTNAAIYTGNGSNLQAFINTHGGQTIFLPTGVYNVPTELYFGINNTFLKGAGIWFTEIHFSSILQTNMGGLRADASGISFSDFYLTTSNASRSNAYKGINGVYTATSTIRNIWVEHFECGAWIAQYNTNGPTIADGFLISNCRFRNNFADGINLCKGTSNSIVEHCNFRNNGDDDQAIWCANGLECINNTFRFNTSENCWRASGLAIYGGKNNKAYNLLIRDNLEAGIRISNTFAGVGFNTTGLHEIHDITIQNCGTFNALFRDNVGAIDIICGNEAGTLVQNVKLSNIIITDSKSDAINIQKQTGGSISNLIFDNIVINGTGKEYPFNNLNNSNTKRGYFVNLNSYPIGNAKYCNMNYFNRGGNALTDENTAFLGTFSWTQTVICLPLNTESQKIDNIQLFPNPSTSVLNIKLNTNKIISKLIVLDIYGKTIIIQNQNIRSINVEKFEKGIYLLEVFSGDEKIVSKFVKD